MDKLSIKIKISDREYPMKVDPADEEMIRKATSAISQRPEKPGAIRPVVLHLTSR